MKKQNELERCARERIENLIAEYEAKALELDKAASCAPLEAGGRWSEERRHLVCDGNLCVEIAEKLRRALSALRVFESKTRHDLGNGLASL